MHKKIFALVGLLWLVGALNPSFSQEKKQVCKRVTKTEFKEKLETLEDVQLIDVRTPAEYNRGTIEGAVNIDFMSPSFEKKIAELDLSKPTLIFCQSGGRSAKALYKMRVMGFEYVLELKGGYGNWSR